LLWATANWRGVAWSAAAGGLRVRVARQCGRSPDRRGDVALGWIEQHELAEHRRAQPVRLLP
jgi:hypothetical protein